jgi:hypothetical protein
MLRIPVAALALALVLPAAARAGTYHVYSCAAGGGSYANNAWAASGQTGVSIRSSCTGGMALAVSPTLTMANNTSGALVFRAPAGDTIADFALTRSLSYSDTAASGSHQYYVTHELGNTVFEGAGDYDAATRDNLNRSKRWYGYPQGPATVGRATITRADFPPLANKSTGLLVFRVGCFNRATPCGGATISDVLYGSDITIDDPTPPAVTVAASGLLAGGERAGSDPVTVTATDSSGIRRVDLIDVTNSAAPAVVGAEDYSAGGHTDANRACDFTLAAPCPQLSAETVQPTSLMAGRRSLLVRVTDTAGNIADAGPYPLFAVSPSDRGAPNGAGATDNSTFRLAFTRTSSPRQTVSYGKHVKVRGRLVNVFGQPISGAHVDLLTRDLRKDAPVVRRQTLTTSADGSFVANVAATASRLLQFAWKALVNDATYSANGYLTLRARASGSLHASTSRPRVGHTMTLSGRLHGVGRKGVVVILQGRPPGTHHFTTFADTTASSHGLFKVHYRFRSGGSHGKRFSFRARIRPVAGFPYETGYSQIVTVRVR